MKYTVLCDSREQQGWNFEVTENCGGTHIVTLATGDYTLKGLETRLVIERKGSLSEFAGNLVQKRFERELERMEAYEWPFIILEFDMETVTKFPVGSGIPRYKWPSLRVTKWFILKRIAELQLKYKTKILFAGPHGKILAASIFKRVTEYVEQETTG